MGHRHKNLCPLRLEGINMDKSNEAEEIQAYKNIARMLVEWIAFQDYSIRTLNNIEVRLERLELAHLGELKRIEVL